LGKTLQEYRALPSWNVIAQRAAAGREAISQVRESAIRR
jgi:hypothetical protein